MMKKRLALLFYTLIFLSTGTSWSATLQKGNILVSTSNHLHEYTPDGTLVQSYPIPYPGTLPPTETARDTVVTTSGHVFVYNGTFSPYLSTLNTINGTWDHRTHENWNTANNVSYGGIATFDHFVFVTDTLSDGKGVVRFDLAQGTSERFAEGIDPIDLTVGLDGLLYVLYPSGSPGGRFIHVFDPSNMDFIHSVSLANIFGHTEHRAIAVNANGDIFIADWDGEIQKIDAAGNILNTRILNHCNFTCNLNDINISKDGLIVIADRFGGITLTDENFTNISHFQAGTTNAFAAIISEASLIFDVADDSYLRESSPFTNYGTESILLADKRDRDPDNGIRGEVISVLQWDLSAIPEEVVVQASSVTLNLFNTSRRTYYIYAAQVPWSEDTVTWSDFNTSAAIGSNLLGKIKPGIMGENVIDWTPAGLNLIQGWIDGSIANHGIVVKSRRSRNGIGFNSSEAAVGQPILMINY